MSVFHEIFHHVISFCAHSIHIVFISGADRWAPELGEAYDSRWSRNRFPMAEVAEVDQREINGIGYGYRNIYIYIFIYIYTIIYMYVYIYIYIYIYMRPYFGSEI